MFTLNMFYCGEEKIIQIAEATDNEGLHDKQIVVYRTEKEQMDHHKTIKGGILFHSSFNCANHINYLLFRRGYKCSSTFVKGN